jgi:hypothetical protein
MPRAYLVLPQNYGYDDFYFYEDSPSCMQPEAIFLDRADAENHVRLQTVPYLMREDVPVHFFHREEIEELSPEKLERVREILELDSEMHLAEYLASYPDLDQLPEGSIRELVDLMNVKALCIVEADIDETEFNKLKKGIGKRDPSETFRQAVSGAFDLPMNEDEPFDD